MNSYKITGAEEGGYFVETVPTYSTKDHYHPVMFAGTLDECLRFMRTKLYDCPSTPPMPPERHKP